MLICFFGKQCYCSMLFTGQRNKKAGAEVDGGSSRLLNSSSPVFPKISGEEGKVVCGRGLGLPLVL